MNIASKYLKEHRLKIITVLVLQFFATSSELFIPWAFAYMIDYIVPTGSIKTLVSWGGLMIAVAIFMLLISFLLSHLIIITSVSIAKKLRNDTFEKVAYLSCSQIDSLTIASITSRLTSDISNLQNFVSMILKKGIRTPLLLVNGICMSLILDVKLSIIMGILLPLVGVLIYITTTRSYRLFRLTKGDGDKLVQLIRENVLGIRVIKALSKTKYEKKRFAQVNESFVEKTKKAEMTSVVSTPIMKSFINFGMVAALYFGAVWVNGGTSQATSVIVFISYFTIILNSLLNLSAIFNGTSRAAASVARVIEVLSLENDATTINFMSEDKAPDYHIEFSNVSFSYSDERECLNDISFQLKRGETLGIIGSTACGKTTVINLLMRLYDTKQGEIRINGKNTKNIPLDKLYQMFGAVFQTDIIFADTVKNNVAFKRDVSMENIEKAVKTAQMEEFVNNLSEGYDSLINVRGQNISGGQKQRILIARALAANPEILILDDSTSALDYKTDALLREELAKNYDSTTKILISQRISSIIAADNILVIDDGKIIGCGTHDELVSSCEYYKKISDAQLGENLKLEAVS